MSWEIRRYTADDAKRWDDFVNDSRNATFIFLREYMDYHADRFTDCSLMAFRRGKLAAILPANIVGETLHSHQGLSYGGWCLPRKGIDGSEYSRLWEVWLQWCRDNAISEIIYKPLPYIYHLMPSQEDIYMLLRYGTPLESNLSSVIDLSQNPGFNKNQRRHISHLPEDVKFDHFHWTGGKKIDEFHSMLTECLSSRHATLPVHSLEELRLLMTRLSYQIRIWGAWKGKNMHAGVCTYLTPMCVHCQYIATTPEGREENMLPGLFDAMIAYYTDMGIRYFDFGISNERNGRLNAGLNRQKTSFGASGVAYTHWLIKTE